jgi:hypothetical protein
VGIPGSGEVDHQALSSTEAGGEREQSEKHSSARFAIVEAIQSPVKWDASLAKSKKAGARAASALQPSPLFRHDRVRSIACP